MSSSKSVLKLRFTKQEIFDAMKANATYTSLFGTKAFVDVKSMTEDFTDNTQILIEFNEV